MEKTEVPKHPKHNPSVEWTDWVEVVGIAFGFVDLVIFVALFFQTFPTGPNLFWLFVTILFLIPGIFGLLPVIVSKRKISREKRALLSLISLVPWIYLALIQLKII